MDGTPGYFEPGEEKTYDYRGFRALLPFLKEFSVEYPDYAIAASTQEKLLLTHGHHLDPSQTLLGKIEDLAKKIQGFRRNICGDRQ